MPVAPSFPEKTTRTPHACCTYIFRYFELCALIGMYLVLLLCARGYCAVLCCARGTAAVGTNDNEFTRTRFENNRGKTKKQLMKQKLCRKQKKKLERSSK